MKKLLLAATIGLCAGLAPPAFAAVDLATGPFDFDAKKFSGAAFTDSYDFLAGPDGGWLSLSLAELKLQSHVDIDWDDTAALSVVASDGEILYQAGESGAIHSVLFDKLDVPASFSVVLKGTAIGDAAGLWSPGLRGSYGLSVIATPVPEPEAYALMLAGLGGIGYMSKRRRRQD